MNITQEADYAIRAILLLSQKNEEEKIDAKTISETENIPLRFLLKLLRKLMQSGIVKSYRGVNGGYGLLKNPKEITMRQVIEAIDGPITLNRCLYDKNFCNSRKNSYCVVHNSLKKIQDNLVKELDSVNFYDLANKIKGDSLIHL